jgi:hypothetical protein
MSLTMGLAAHVLMDLGQIPPVEALPAANDWCILF